MCKTLFRIIVILVFLLLVGCKTKELNEDPMPVDLQPTQVTESERPTPDIKEPITATPEITLKPYPMYQEDAEELIRLLETRHVMFALGRVPEGYESVKREFLKGSSEARRKEHFSFLAAKFTAALKDGHTMTYLSYGDVIPLELRWHDGKLYILSKDINEWAEVVKIGGIDVGEIAEEALKYRACENTSAEEFQIENFARSYNTLNHIGAEVKTNGVKKVNIEYIQEGESATKVYFFGADSSNHNIGGKTAKYTIENCVFIMTMYNCTVNEDWETSVDAMKMAVNDGIDKIVIDVRGNPGGYSTASTGILDALDMEYGTSSMDVYYNEDTYEIYGGTKEDIGTVKHFEGEMRHANPKNIKLYVLVDRSTYSAAMELAAKVQDSDLGSIVGEIPSNSPSSYGSCQSYELKNSKLYFQLSSKWIERADKERPGNALIPDVLLLPREDALEYFWESIFHGL